MCDIKRREMLIGGAALLGLSMKEAKALVATSKLEVGKVDSLAPEVYFHKGNPFEVTATTAGSSSKITFW